MSQTTDLPAPVPTLPDDAGGDAPPSIAAPPPRWRLPKLSGFRVLWPVVALGLLLAYNYQFTPRYFHLAMSPVGRVYGTPVDILHYATPIVLLALGMTLVIATGGVDLSVGATMAIVGTIVAAWIRGPVDAGGLPTGHGGTMVVAVALGLLAAVACGAWNGLLVAVFDIQPIVATLILMVAGRGIAERVSQGQTITLTQFGKPLGWLHYVDGGHGWLYQHAIYPIPLDVVWAVVAIAVIGYLTRRTALGLFLESVGNNAVASRYAGVNAVLVKFVAYVVCGVTAGMAGLLVTADNNTASIGLGTTKELDAILAVSLGGTALAGGRFSLAGSVIGAVIIAALFETIQLTQVRGHPIPPQWFGVAEAIVILVVCLLQSDAFRSTILSVVPKARSRRI